MKPSPAPEAPLRVLYIGRLSPEKGVDVLLRAWSIFLHPSPLSGAEQTAPSDPPPSERGGAQSASTDKPPSERGVARSAGGSTPTSTASANHSSSLFTLHSSLTIVGDGPERPVLESLAASLGISDRVEFAGALSRAAARAAIATASLLVLPSICYEQFSTTVLEAMQVGIPTLVSDVARAGTIVEDGVTGRFFAAGDPESLAAALRELLADPIALRSMGDAARAAFEASDCIPCRNLARLERVYASCKHDA